MLHMFVEINISLHLALKKIMLHYIHKYINTRLYITKLSHLYNPSEIRRHCGHRIIKVFHSFPEHLGAILNVVMVHHSPLYAGTHESMRTFHNHNYCQH